MSDSSVTSKESTLVERLDRILCDPYVANRAMARTIREARDVLSANPSAPETSARVETPDWRKLPFHPSLIPALRRAAKRGDLICGAAADALEAMTVPKITGAREIEYPERGGLSYEGTSQPNDRGNRATEETDSDRPAAPVSEERCQCGHSARAHHIGTTDIKGPCGTCSCMEWRSSAQETSAPRGKPCTCDNSAVSAESK